MPKIVTDSDRLQKRRIILDAAAAEIARYGYDRANINTIAERAGIGRGTIYLYYTNKEDVLLSLLNSIGSMIDEIVCKCINSDQSWPQKIRDLALAFAQMALDHNDFFRVHISALHGVNRDIGQPVAFWLMKSFHRLTAALVQAIQEGEIFLYDPQTLAWIILGTLESMALLPNILNLSESLTQERANSLATFIWQGIAPSAKNNMVLG